MAAALAAVARAAPGRPVQTVVPTPVVATPVELAAPAAATPTNIKSYKNWQLDKSSCWR